MKFRKKPVVIEAVQWTGDNFEEIQEFYPDAELNTIGDGVYVKTEEGLMLGSIGDYIIKGIKGEFYPCKPDIFELTYDKVEE